MSVSSLAGPDRRRLRVWMAAFFLALAVPTAVLVMHAFGQLKWEAFHQHRQIAQALSLRIDAELSRLLAVEEARSFADYGFLVVTGDPSANFLQRSPLSTFPPRADLPGLVGYFQVDTEGRFSTPLLPVGAQPVIGYGVGSSERARRVELESQIREVLSDNRLVEGRAPRRRVAVPGRESSLALESPERGQPLPDAAVPASAPDPHLLGVPGLARVYRDDAAAPRAAPAQKKDEGKSVPQAILQADARPNAEADADTVAARRESRSKTLREAPAAIADMAGRAPTRTRADEPSPVQAQAAFDQLKGNAAGLSDRKRKATGKLGRIEDLELVSGYFEKQASERQQVIEEERVRENVASLGKRTARKERSLLPEDEAAPGEGVQPRIRTFESEVDPFEFSLLDSGHFVLFRKVWRDGERYIQGVLIEQQPFLEGVAGRAFQTSALATTSNLAAAWDGDLLWAVGAAGERYTLTSAEDLSGALLHRERLSAPFSDLELVFTVARLPAGPGARVVAWVAAVIAIVLCGGLALMYRLGVRQLDLARQQQDFVSAVSHELRTPLTSIRMYAEMLKQGWAGEDKKRSYYQYIFDESERLSRLISNVLQLARMTRNEFAVETRPITVAALMDGIASKVSSQVEQAGFELVLTQAPDLADTRVQVDEDAFSQIVINLVDNAIKFSARSPVKRIEVVCRDGADGGVEFTVRDHGPGVPRDQMKKIFRLFYRTQGELTREAVGTGIGLALVNELARAMGARVDVSNVDPGAKFSVWIPRVSAGG